MYDINILECDKAKIKMTVYSRLIAATAMDGSGIVVPSEPVDVATANIGLEARGAKRRRAGADGSKTRC
jgi:hypothetical protein